MAEIHLRKSVRKLRRFEPDFRKNGLKPAEILAEVRAEVVAEVGAEVAEVASQTRRKPCGGCAEVCGGSTPYYVGASAPPWRRAEALRSVGQEASHAG